MNNALPLVKRQISRLTMSAMFLAMALLLPFLTGQIPQIGSLISPMHIPAFLCGMTCGPVWGIVVGGTAPILRSLLFTMPPMAMAPLMAAELAAYGALSGVLMRILPKGNLWLYVNLAISMIGGRLLYAAAKMVMLGIQGSEIAPLVILADTVTGTWVGIIVHFVVIPPLVMLVKRLQTERDGNSL